MMLKYLRRHKGVFLLVLLLLFLVDAAQLFIPIVVRNVIDGLQREPALPSILVAGATIAGIGLAMFAMRAIWRALLMFMAFRIVTDIRERLFGRLLHFSQDAFHRWDTGDLMARATNDLNAVRSFFSFGIISIFDMIVLGAAALGFMIYLSPALTLVAVLPLPLLALSVFFFEGRIHRTFQLVQAKYSDLTTFVQEAFSGIFVVKAFHAETRQRELFEKKNQEFIRHQMDLARLNAFFDPMMTLIVAASNVLVLYVGGRGVMEGSLTLGDLVGFVAYLDTLAWPVMAMGFSVTVYQRGKASLQRIEEITESPLEPRVAGGSEFRNPGSPVSVRVAGLTFAYPGREPILRDLSFDIPAGKTLGILGRVGSGKSTLVKILSGLVEVPRGMVSLNGHDVAELNLRSLRTLLTVIPQEAFLFSLSVRDNIAFERPGAPQEEIARAAWIADMAETIAGMPQGYETLIGERGVNLSGGQKQRLTLARAIMKPSPLFLFDDCFSAVDTETEERILTRLREALGVSTALIITHRVSTLRFADEILVLDEGRVAERGTHAELMALRGAYASLYEKQILSEKLART